MINKQDKINNTHTRLLDDEPVGMTVQVVRVMGDGAFRQRLLEMGFVRGAQVTVLKNAPLKDPVEYVSGTKVGDTPSYWQITDTKGNFVTNCYSVDFYYVAYDNYLVKAIYGQGKGKDLYDKFISSDINDLGVTRSHWNDTASGLVYVPGNDESENRTAANHDYDRMFVDLALSYSDGQETLLNKQDNLKVGFVIQYKSGDKWVDFQSAEFDSTKLDNKNRIEYYYGFNNAAGNRDAMLRAVPYIGENRHETGAVEFNFNTTFFSGGAEL